jgi:hypothetical protein
MVYLFKHALKPGTFHSKVLPEAKYPKLKPDLSTEVKGKESQGTFLNPVAFEINP